MSTTVSGGAGVALVTGASRGIGRAAALRLAKGGYAIAINYRSSATEAEAVAQEINDEGCRAELVQADMADVEQARRLVDRVEASLGPLDILINNAGITRDRLLLQMSVDDWNATWSTDLAGPRALAHDAIAKMSSRRRGKVVMVSSVVGVSGNAGQANYAAAKSAMMGLTRELAVSGAKSGVNVNCVVPGYIVTDATSHLDVVQRETWIERIPMRRSAGVNEVVGAISFLASEAASYITGQCIAVDGGLLALAGAGLAS